MELYRLTLKVRPAPHHPLYLQWRFGFLGVWLFACDEQSAASAAFVIIQQLPYEIVDCRAAVAHAGDPKFKARADEACETGLSLQLAACRSFDEGDFEEGSLPA